MPLTQNGLTITFSGGPIFLQSIGSGNLVVYDDVANGDGRLYKDVAGVVTQIGTSTFDAGGFTLLADGSYLLYRQQYDLNYGGAHYEVLSALGSVEVPDSDVVGGTGRPITGPSATATKGGGFFIGYTDGQSANGTGAISFSPPDQNNNTVYNAPIEGDAGYRYFEPSGVGTTYQPGDFDTANTGTFTTVANGGSAHGPNTVGQQSVSGVATLADGTIVESYVNQYYFPQNGGGLDSANEIVVRLVTPSGPSNPITVSQLQIPSNSLDAPNLAIRGNGGIQVVALPAGFAVIWHEDHVVNDASAFGGYDIDGFDTKIRYFDTSGHADTNTIFLYHQGSGTGAGNLYASADSLGDGRIALVYASTETGGENGTDATQLSVGVVGALGATFDSSTITPTPTSGHTQSNWDLVSTGGSNIAVSYTDSQDGAELNTFDIGTACYCEGTAIWTVDGDVPIENLAAGDLVMTATGARRPIIWLGHRRLDTTKHHDPRAVWPVRVQAGGFGEALPRRDLWMSPGHNVFVGGVLMPVRVLINGVTVTQETVDTVTYWHVELGSHDIILAEGLPAESYLDTGNRSAFANAGPAIELNPDFEPKHWTETCVPLVKAGPEVEAARRMLLARAEELGHATTAVHDLHVVAGGRRVAPIALGPKRFAFTLPAGCEAIRLASRTFVPCHVNPEATDSRVLGVRVRRLQIDGEEIDLRTLPADDWHAVEVKPDYVERWTRGEAALPPRARVVVVDLAGAGRYWIDRKDNVVALRA